jgi:hypothetical protein
MGISGGGGRGGIGRTLRARFGRPAGVRPAPRPGAGTRGESASGTASGTAAGRAAGLGAALAAWLAAAPALAPLPGLIPGLWVGAGALALAPREAAAEGWSFRRVGVPQAGATDRITVQIDPNAPRRIAAPQPPQGPARAGSAAGAGRGGGVPGAGVSVTAGGVAWFWSEISPALADSGPGRLAPALRRLDAAPEGFAPPRLQALQEIARAHGPDILRATVGTRVSPALVIAVIAVESSGRVDAVSSAGAGGLMQLMPATAARFGVGEQERFVAADNIRGGVAYLDWLLGHFDGDPILALAAYNAGEGAVRDNGGVPPFAETRAYVPKVLSAWTVARGLCVTPPELVSDGCVFAVNTL